MLASSGCALPADFARLLLSHRKEKHQSSGQFVGTGIVSLLIVTSLLFKGLRMLSNHGLISKKLPLLPDTSIKSMPCLREGGFSSSSCRTLRRPGQARGHNAHCSQWWASVLGLRGSGSAGSQPVSALGATSGHVASGTCPIICRRKLLPTGGAGWCLCSHPFENIGFSSEVTESFQSG